MTVAVTFCTTIEKGVAKLGKLRVVGISLMVHGCPHSVLLLLKPGTGAALDVDEVDELDGIDELDELELDEIDKADEVDVVDELE
jgi:hypothetical protein